MTKFTSPKSMRRSEVNFINIFCQYFGAKNFKPKTQLCNFLAPKYQRKTWWAKGHIKCQTITYFYPKITYLLKDNTIWKHSVTLFLARICNNNNNDNNNGCNGPREIWSGLHERLKEIPSDNSLSSRGMILLCLSRTVVLNF